MTAQSPTIRETLNNGVLQQTADLSHALCLGDLLARLISASAADETLLNPVVGGNDLTLAATPSCLLDLVSLAGAFTGRLQLLVGDPDKVLPAPGQAVWGGPGSARVTFNAGDAITNLSAWYTVAADTVSLMDRTLGQAD